MSGSQEFAHNNIALNDRSVRYGLTHRDAANRGISSKNNIEGFEFGGKNIMLPAKTPTAKELYGSIDSHQFDPDENEIWKEHQRQRHEDDLGHWWTFTRMLELRRWSLALFTGFWVGVCALFVSYSTRFVTGKKYEIFHQMIEQEKRGELRFGSAYLFLLGYNLLCATIAWLAVYVEPLAGGSGIPEVKCFLNGLNIPKIVSLKTTICKAIGIIFSCSAGLPLGKEGPMIHIGAGVAATVTQVQNTGEPRGNANNHHLHDFRNDKEKRDLVSCGAAAGVAAAFGAPMGGVMFAFEEGASFWTAKLTWRCFFCCLTTVSSVYIINSLPNMLRRSNNGAMFSFGEFVNLSGEVTNYNIWEFVMFLMVGFLGGILGACFCYLSGALGRFRRNVLYKYVHRLIEVWVITALMTSLAFFVSYAWTTCTPLPLDMTGWTEQEKQLTTELHALYCPRGTHYNELASLYLTDSDHAIKQLFHFREVGDRVSSGTFSSAALFFFGFPYFFMACLCTGIGVPAGLFVPSLLSGAAIGRLLGHILHKLDHIRGTFADSGTYALMGAAAITAGVTRITISLTMMILEATGGLQYVLPLMMTTMAAFMLGNVFTFGMYEQHIRARNLHFLEAEESVSSIAEFHALTVADIMTTRPVCLRSVVRVGELYDSLRENRHQCFPIALDVMTSRLPNDDDSRAADGVYTMGGTVSRKVLCTLLQRKIFAPAAGGPNKSHFATSVLSWDAIECMYPDYPRIEEITIDAQDRARYIDLTSYIDTAAHTIHVSASAGRAYRMFRTLGLRHLIVVSDENKIAGITTRANFAALDVETAENAVKLARQASMTPSASIEMEEIQPLFRR